VLDAGSGKGAPLDAIDARDVDAAKIRELGRCARHAIIDEDLNASLWHEP
jgi:hypothetical protein